MYGQVKVAYSVTRKIYLISLGTKGVFKVIPADVSGKIIAEYFAVSTSTKSKENWQLGAIGKCLIAEMNSSAYSEVYKLEKNHMKNLVNVDAI